MRTIVLTLTAAFCVCAALGEANSSSDEKKLWAVINGDNDPSFFPGAPIQRIDVTTSVSLVTLSDYDHGLGTLRVGYWLRMLWNLPSLKWKPSDHKGIKKIHVPSRNLWLPDIVPYKHTETLHAIESRVIVSSDGGVMWVPHLMSTLLCEPVRGGPAFPRDQRVCLLKFGSWVYDGSLLNLTETPGWTDAAAVANLDSNPLRSSGWQFVSVARRRYVTHYLCCSEPYISMEVNVTIARSGTYFTTAVGVPGAITGLIVSFLFLLPPAAPSRIIAQSVCLLILVFIAVSDLRLMGSTTELAPAAHFFMAAMAIDLFALLWSIVMAAAWLQASARPFGEDRVSPMMRTLGCLLLLPAVTVDIESHELQEEGEERRPHHSSGLNNTHRLCLVLDRLLAIVSLLLFLILFRYLGA